MNNTISYRIPRGSFVQDYLTRNWDDGRWQQELQTMKEAGMDILIFSPAVMMDEKNKKVTVIYPSEIPELKKGFDGFDCIEPCLRNCQQAGIKVYIALNQSWHFWDFGWYNSTTKPEEFKNFWDNNARICNAVIDELYALYKSKYPGAFYGWYWIHEFWNYTLCTNTYEGKCPKLTEKDRDSWAPDPSVITDIIAEYGFSPVLDHMTAVDASMPMLFSNFANQKLCKPESNARFWGDIIKKARFRPGDVMAPMDSIGAKGVTLDHLDEWTKSYKQATDQNSALTLWSNNELFINDEGEIALLNQYVEQVSITSKYAKENISFAWNHYYSPYNVLPGYNKIYMQYVKTGSIQKDPPAPVDKNTVTVTKSGNQYKINWIYDDNGLEAASFNVYHNGKLYVHLFSNRFDSSNRPPVLERSFIAKETGNYELEVIDFAGNCSLKTPFTIL